ncbi:MAG TPA: hypothetical protein VGB30_02855 [bacterium]|jgi:hypothetical protein
MSSGNFFSTSINPLHIIAGVIILYLAISIIFYNSIPTEQEQTKKAISNLEIIQERLESYADDHEGLYPEKIRELKSGGYISLYPPNPWSNTDMMEVSGSMIGSEGDVAYVPYIEEDIVKGYYLVLIGFDQAVDEYDVTGDQLKERIPHILSGRLDGVDLPELKEYMLVK